MNPYGLGNLKTPPWYPWYPHSGHGGAEPSENAEKDPVEAGLGSEDPCLRGSLLGQGIGVVEAGKDVSDCHPVPRLDEHLDHYETMLASNLGLGVQAVYRGRRLYDTERTRDAVRKWVDWYKRNVEEQSPASTYTERPKSE